MFSTISKAIQMLYALWQAIKALFGFIEQKKHESVVKDVDKAVEQGSRPGAKEEERREATKRLEDIANKRT